MFFSFSAVIIYAKESTEEHSSDDIYNTYKTPDTVVHKLAISGWYNFATSAVNSFTYPLNKLNNAMINFSYNRPFKKRWDFLAGIDIGMIFPFYPAQGNTYKEKRVNYTFNLVTDDTEEEYGTIKINGLTINPSLSAGIGVNITKFLKTYLTFSLGTSWMKLTVKRDNDDSMNYEKRLNSATMSINSLTSMKLLGRLNQNKRWSLWFDFMGGYTAQWDGNGTFKNFTSMEGSFILFTGIHLGVGLRVVIAFQEDKPNKAERN